MYQIIPSPIPNSLIFREANLETFRPATFYSASDSIKTALTKLKMERLEIESATALHLSPIACAAHFSRLEADLNASNELNERLSLSAWWVYRRGGMTASPSMREELAATAEVDMNHFKNITIGEIPSVTADENVWVSIIETATYPYAVLGAASHGDKTVAAKRAFEESLLSYGASLWLRRTNPTQAPRWDFGELHARTQNDTRCTTDQFRDNDELMRHIQGRRTILTLGEASVVLITSPLFNSYSTANLANLVGQQNEKAVVHTEANF